MGSARSIGLGDAGPRRPLDRCGAPPASGGDARGPRIRRRRTDMSKRNLPVLGDRPGWTGLIEALEERIGNKESRRAGRPRVTASAVVDGMLTVEIRGPEPFDFGAAAANG